MYRRGFAPRGTLIFRIAVHDFHIAWTFGRSGLRDRFVVGVASRVIFLSRNNGLRGRDFPQRKHGHQGTIAFFQYFGFRQAAAADAFMGVDELLFREILSIILRKSRVVVLLSLIHI